MKDAQLVLKAHEKHQTVIKTSTSLIGARELFIAAGPCAVESHEQLDVTAEALKKAPVQAFRGCIFKPRTSPYSFQGLAQEGVAVLEQIKQTHKIPVITEVMSTEQISQVRSTTDILQIGSRNMQNFELLKAVGACHQPVILKRGLAATIEEFILAAEYIASHGNPNIILCERGIRSFDTFTRNVLDLGAVVALKQLTHLPVIVDPSHAAGKRELIADLSRAAVACGADGLIIECHPNPEQSISDARQALSLDAMVDLVHSLRPIARAVGRRIAELEAAHNNNVLSIERPTLHSEAHIAMGR